MTEQPAALGMPRGAKQEYDALATAENASSIYAASELMPEQLQREVEQGRWRRLLIGLVASDVLVCSGLYAVTTTLPGRESTFSGDTEDTLWLALGRVVSVVVLVWVATSKGVPAESATPPHLRSASDRAKQGSAMYWRRGSLAILFVLLTACSVFTGVKCVVYEFIDETSENHMAPLLALSIGLTNLIFWASKRLISSHAKSIGAVTSHLHVHPLRFFHDGAPVGGPRGPGGGRGGGGGGRGGGGGGGPGRRNVCDVCRSNVSAKPSYTCTDCRFNLCVECFETKSMAAVDDEEENVVRSDKGKQTQFEISSSSYMRRSFQLARGEWRVIATAFLSLLVGTAANLVRPKYQGFVLDSVIAGDQLGFEDAIRIYLALAVISGLFDSIRQCCFMIVGRRIGFATRNKLYSAILRQDIAFCKECCAFGVSCRVCCLADHPSRMCPFLS